MNNIYLISDFTQKLKGLASSLNITDENIISYVSHDNEKEVHEWLTKEFSNKDIEKILIPVSLPTDAPIINTDGFLVALHIRLNYELKINKRLIPIIFLSNFSFAKLIEKNNFDKDNNPQNLVFTKGIFFSSFDTDDIEDKVNKAEACRLEEYHGNVLDKLIVLRKETFGGHDIANAWGCFKLAQVTGLRDEIFKLESISKHLKQLYAKSLICKNDSFANDRMIDLDPIKCVGKNILFIDDKSDEGWGHLMKNVFKGAGSNFVFVDSSKYKADDAHKSFKNFAGFYSECQSHIGKDWDLIIIDLRLNPEKEDIDNEMMKPTEFSGYKLIDEFLTENEGYQIIVSTASNKIWNINAALERGASSYYVKESPEFNYSISETNKHYENFKSDVRKCFERNYLRDIYKFWDLARKENSNPDATFIHESDSMLDIAWNLTNQEQLDLGYLTLFQIIESYANKKYDYRDNSIDLEGVKNYMIEDVGDKEQWKLTFSKDRINGDYFSSGDEEKSKGIRANALYKASCLLKFIYAKDDIFLKEFGKLNELRHNIAHKGAKGFAKTDDIINALKIINLFRQKNN
jgi:CheY-like chemotaxis protein